MTERGNERIQPAGEGDAWNDSLYFNFFSKDDELAGFTRIGVLPNTGRANAGLVAVKDGAPFAGMVAADTKIPEGDWDDIEVEGLRYRVTDPLKRCRVDLDSPTGKASLEFEAIAEPFDYADCPVKLPPEVASGHYEQHCRVTGWVEGFDGRHEITGFGQRDHSWGLRDWKGVHSWRWLQAIFGEDFAFNVFSVTTHAGKAVASGYVYEDGESRALSQASIETEYDDDGTGQRSVTVKLQDTSGQKREITGERFGLLPIPMEGARVNEGLFKWEAGGRTGYGVYEYLYQE